MRRCRRASIPSSARSSAGRSSVKHTHPIVELAFSLLEAEPGRSVTLRPGASDELRAALARYVATPQWRPAIGGLISLARLLDQSAGSKQTASEIASLAAEALRLRRKRRTDSFVDR